MLRIKYLEFLDVVLRYDFKVNRINNNSRFLTARTSESFADRSIENSNYLELLKVQYPSNWDMNRNPENDILLNLPIQSLEGKEYIMLDSSVIEKFSRKTLADQVKFQEILATLEKLNTPYDNDESNESKRSKWEKDLDDEPGGRCYNPKWDNIR